MGERMRVLLVEDDREECEAMEAAFAEREGMRLVGATGDSGRAEELVREQLPHAVILDLELHEGGGSGLLFLQGLKRNPPIRMPYILVTTNNTSRMTYESVRLLGADFILSKHQRDYGPSQVAEFLSMMRPVILRETVEERGDATPAAGGMAASRAWNPAVSDSGDMSAHTAGNTPAYAAGNTPACAAGNTPACAAGNTPAYAAGNTPAYAAGNTPACAAGNPPASAAWDASARSRKRMQRIHRELDLVGISPKAVGYGYLAEGILLLLDSPSPRVAEKIASRHNKSGASVERAMQNAISTAWRRMPIEELYEHYTARIDPERGVPTLSEFLNHYAGKLRDEGA